jgi:hypothetical protein
VSNFGQLVSQYFTEVGIVKHTCTNENRTTMSDLLMGDHETYSTSSSTEHVRITLRVTGVGILSTRQVTESNIDYKTIRQYKNQSLSNGFVYEYASSRRDPKSSLRALQGIM